MRSFNSVLTAYVCYTCTSTFRSITRSTKTLFYREPSRAHTYCTHAHITQHRFSAVSPKIPNPWPENMDMWLTVVDSQFVTRGVTQELTKFHYVVGALTPDLADRLRHIICNPPPVIKRTHLCGMDVRQGIPARDGDRIQGTAVTTRPPVDGF